MSWEWVKELKQLSRVTKSMWYWDRTDISVSGWVFHSWTQNMYSSVCWKKEQLFGTSVPVRCYILSGLSRSMKSKLNDLFRRKTSRCKIQGSFALVTTGPLFTEIKPFLIVLQKFPTAHWKAKAFFFSPRSHWLHAIWYLIPCTLVGNCSKSILSKALEFFKISAYANQLHHYIIKLFLLPILLSFNTVGRGKERRRKERRM